MPDASPRSVVGSPAPPRSWWVIQSWGSSTPWARSSDLGLVLGDPAQLGDREAGHRDDCRCASAQACGPPSSSIRASACGAERLSFHSRASRTGVPASSTSTMPCCWPPTATASTPSSSPAEACSQACHQTRASTSVTSGWGARPSRTTSPVSASQTTTLVFWVEQSMPATSVMGETTRRPRHGAGVHSGSTRWGIWVASAITVEERTIPASDEHRVDHPLQVGVGAGHHPGPHVAGAGDREGLQHLRDAGEVLGDRLVARPPCRISRVRNAVTG